MHFQEEMVNFFPQKRGAEKRKFKISTRFSLNAIRKQGWHYNIPDIYISTFMNGTGNQTFYLKF